MMEPKFCQLTKDKGVARIILNRPKHNVLNIGMMEALTTLLTELDSDNELKCVIIAAKGPSWCAGVEVLEHKPAMAPDMIRVFNALLKQIHSLSIPSIAAVQGTCLGGGMEMAIACDMIVASKTAIFGQPEIKLGFLPPYAAVRLPHLVGPARTVEICTTGRRYTAEAVYRMGLLTELAEPEEFENILDNLLTEIKHCSPLIIRLNKKAVNQHLGMDLDAAVDGVGDLFLKRLMATEDTLEGIRSFEEKRRPQWKNR